MHCSSKSAKTDFIQGFVAWRWYVFFPNDDYSVLLANPEDA